MLVEYARWDAEMRHKTDDGAEVRAYLEASARKGNAEAVAKLHGPEFPEDVEYLWHWGLELHGRSGIGMAGLAPLAYGTVTDWALLTGNVPDALEVEALIAIDAALLSAGRSPKESN